MSKNDPCKEVQILPFEMDSTEEHEKALEQAQDVADHVPLLVRVMSDRKKDLY